MKRNKQQHQTGPIFDFGGLPVRTFLNTGEIWFLLTEICTAISHTSPARATRRLDPDEQKTAIVSSSGGDQRQILVNESGLYHLILTSRKPQAAQFRRLVTNEILPSIRRTGAYFQPDAAGQEKVSAQVRPLSDGEKQLVYAVRQSGRYVTVKKPGRDVWFEPQPYETIVADMADSELRGLAAAAQVTLSLWESARRLDSAENQGALSEGYYPRIDNAIRLNASLADTLIVWRDGAREIKAEREKEDAQESPCPEPSEQD